MTINKIYVQMIDGTIGQIPINARQIIDDQYEILKDPEFESIDSNVLFEFYPGDIVKLGQHKFSNGTNGQIAKELIRYSTQPDRKYWEFMFLATIDRLFINQDTFDKYAKEIERIKKEQVKGQFFYPAILDLIDRLFKMS